MNDIKIGCAIRHKNKPEYEFTYRGTVETTAYIEPVEGASYGLILVTEELCTKEGHNAEYIGCVPYPSWSMDDFEEVED